MNILFILFVGWCITSTTVNADVLDPIRNYLLVKAPKLSKLMTCVRCLGFWVGALLFGAINFLGNLDSFFGLPVYFNYFIFPFVQSSSGVIMESVLVFLHSRNTVVINNNENPK
jgi:hypothetical protein